MATELDAVILFAIANEAYTRESIITVIRSSLSPELNTALNCCLDEGTLDTGIRFFLHAPHVYPEAQVQNNVHNHHVCQYSAMLSFKYGSTEYIDLVPYHLLPKHLVSQLRPTDTFIFA